MGFISSDNTKTENKKTHDFSTSDTIKVEKVDLDDFLGEIWDFLEEHKTEIILGACGLAGCYAFYEFVKSCRRCLQIPDRMQENVGQIQQWIDHLHAEPEQPEQLDPHLISALQQHFVTLPPIVAPSA
jgi:hypothetical protein